MRILKAVKTTEVYSWKPVILDMPLWTLLERTEVAEIWTMRQNVYMGHFNCSIAEQNFGTTVPGLLQISDLHDQYLTILLSGCFLCCSGVSMGEDSGTCFLYTVERKWLQMVGLRSRSFVYCCTTCGVNSEDRGLFSLKQNKKNTFCHRLFNHLVFCCHIKIVITSRLHIPVHGAVKNLQ